MDDDLSIVPERIKEIVRLEMANHYEDHPNYSHDSTFINGFLKGYFQGLGECVEKMKEMKTHIKWLDKGVADFIVFICDRQKEAKTK